MSVVASSSAAPLSSGKDQQQGKQGEVEHQDQMGGVDQQQHQNRGEGEQGIVSAQGGAPLAARQLRATTNNYSTNATPSTSTSTATPTPPSTTVVPVVTVSPPTSTKQSSDELELEDEPSAKTTTTTQTSAPKAPIITAASGSRIDANESSLISSAIAAGKLMILNICGAAMVSLSALFDLMTFILGTLQVS
jgi:hypothetical protein